MEDNFWNPGVESPQDSVNQYDNSLDSSFKEPEIQSGLSAPAEPVDSPQQPQQEEESQMWSPQGMNMEGQPEMQLPDIPEAGKPGIDYDMGHLEKIGKSLMVGMGDMFDSFGDIADFVGSTPSNEIQKQMYGVETDKPVSDAFHDFADYLHSYGDDVPGLTEMQDITFESMLDIEFWETGIARMLPFAFSIAATSGGSAIAVGTAATGARVAGLAAKVAAGARSVGVTGKIANTLNATRMISTAAGTVAAGATGNLMEGTALAGQTMNEAVAQGVDLKVAQNAGRQVFVDNLASLGADIVQWGLFAGQLKIGSVMAKTASKAAAKVAKANGVTAKAAEAVKQVKNMTMTAPLKNAAKALGMGAANGITDGVIEQFQEVYQDWSVQRRIAEAKGEEFVPYMEFFMADEQRPTRVLSFATSLLISGASNTINTAAENRHVLNGAFDSKKESHELLDIFNKKIDEGTYDFKDKDGNLVQMNAEQASAAGKDSAARTMIQNAVAHGNGESIMEWFGVQAEQKNITQEQFDLYKDTFSEIQESIKSYPTQNLNAKEKTLLVANAWLNNLTSKNLEKQRGDFAQRAEDIQNLVTEKKQTKEWAEQEIAGLEKAAEKALEQELAIIEASSKQIAEIYAQNKKTTEQNRFAKEEGKQLVDIAKKDIAGEELNEQEQFLVASNKSFYDESKKVLNQAEATNKAAKEVGKKEFVKYGSPKPQKDGSVEYTKENKDGSIDAIIVSSTGEVTLETNRDDASITGAEKTNKDSAKAEFDKFVDTGKVEKATVNRIAYKIKNNRGLTKEEMAMREGAAEEVEALLKTKVETKKETKQEFTSDELANDQDTVKSEVYETTDDDGRKVLVTIKTAKDGSRKVSAETFDENGESLGTFEVGKFGKNNTLSNEKVADVFNLGKEATLKLVETKEGFEANYSKKQVENRKAKRRAEREEAEKLSEEKAMDNASLEELDTSGMTKKAAELAMEYELSGMDVANITPTGKNGRITKADVQKYIKDTPVDSLPEAEGLKLKFLKSLESAKAAVAITKTAAKDYTKKTFTKENVGKIIDVLERAYMKRKIKNAIPLVAGTENAVIDMMSEKAADGLVSVNGIINLSKQGPNIAGYAAGMSVFVSIDNDPDKEAFFHENFHIFRVLYANAPEVREMMKHIVNQPIYNKTKLDYQENILYAAPSRKGEKASIRQETALKLIKNRTGDIMATTIEDYIVLNSIENVTADTYKAFYEESLAILTKNNYVELAAAEQTNIQDEALTKLAGLYGSYNQDMFISDEGKRKAYNESMKSWKEKISKAFTKEESAWSLEEASKNQYKKGDDFDFETAFSQIKDLIAKEEAEYGNIAKESPSTVAVKALKTKKLTSLIEQEMSKAESSINKDAKAFYKTISSELLKEGEFENATDEQIVANRKAILKSSKEFRQAKQKFISELLMNYTEGTQEYRDIRNSLRDNNKQVDAYIRQAFVGAMSKDRLTNTQLDMFVKDEFADVDENALVALINGEHQDIAAKFYMHVRQFIENEKYIGRRSDAVKSQVNKANIMFLLKTFQEVYPSPMEFSEKAQAMIKSTRANPSNPNAKQINQIILGDFFNYLQTEVDGSGSNIFKNVMLQFRSMTTDKGRMWDGKRLTPSLSMQLKRKIANAKVESGEAYTEEMSINKQNQKQAMKFVESSQQSIYNNGLTSVRKDDYEVWSNLKQRLNYSRRLIELLYGAETIQEVEKLKFINKFLLSEGNKLTETQFKNLSIKSEDGNYLPISQYLNRSKLEEMLWESVSVGISDLEKQNISLEEFQQRARKDVFTPLFNNYIVNKNRQDSINLGVETNSLTKEKVQELQQVFFNKLADTYKQEKFDSAEFKENTSKKEHIVFEDGSVINSNEAVYQSYFDKGSVDDENPNSRTRKYFLRNSKNDVQELEIKQVKEGFEIKEAKVYKFGQKTSMSMFVSNGNEKITLDDMQGVSYPINALLSAKLPAEDKSYLYTIRSPKGNMLNKNTRKYFLKYGADSLVEYSKTNPLSFLSLFTTDTSQETGVTIYGQINPYAEKIISGEYELEYESLDGDLSKNLDRQEITNKEVSVMDVEEIRNAIDVGSNTYMQVVRDFSDKTRRYYATAFTIKTEKEARVKLKGLVDYHMSKTQTILDRHNDESDEFDIHLVTSTSVIAELRAEGKEIRKTKNEGHTKKGQLNLLGKKAFELEINGVKYDLSKYEDIEESTRQLQSDLDIVSGNAGLIGANYFINKFFLQDLSSSMLEDQNYTMKNKRSTGYIANHDSSYAGERVELFMFEDAELSQSDLKQKVKILAYETDKKTGKTKAVAKEIDLQGNPAIMDSASIMTQEAADKLIALHGEIVDVKGSFKLVGYGNNIDNKKISGMFGQQTNSIYAKGHTIILNETAVGPLGNAYKALKAREKYYEDNNMSGVNVLGYADSGIKKGSIKGVDGSPQNKLSLQEWGELVTQGDDAVNSFMNKYSYDEENDLYGYDGRFFGVQGELDKESETATSSKQMVSGINVFKDHYDVGVQAKTKYVLRLVSKSLNLQYDKEIKNLSREEILKKNADSDSVPTPIQTMLEDGKTSMPFMRDQMIKLLGRKVINGTHKLRTGGTLSLQESDVLYGYEQKAKEIVQTDEALSPMQVVQTKTGFEVKPAEAVISIHLANELGITQEDLDGGKKVKFLATRIPSSSAGSTVVLKVKGIATKPGNTIAVNPLVSAIIGSDLDGDMLHINTINTSDDLSDIDKNKNALVESIIDLYMTPEVQSSLTKEIEFESLMKAHNKELYGTEEGSKDVSNDLSLLGTHTMYGQTKGNAPMIGIIASQNLLYNYISEGNPNLFYNNAPLRVSLDGSKYANLDNKITKEDSGGTWYVVTKWLNLILDDGKNNVRAKYLFTKNTGNTFIMLLKMGVPSPKISSYIKRAGWDKDEFVYWKQPENKGKLEEELKTLLVKEGGKESSSLDTLISNKYMNDSGYIDFNLKSDQRVDHLAMYIAFDKINDDTKNIGHFLSLDKGFEADPMLALEKHQAAVTAIENQTQPKDGLFSGIGNNLASDNTLYRRNKKVNYEIISKFFEDDAFYSNGYKEGLIGGHYEVSLLDSDGILNSEESTNKKKEKVVVSIFGDQEKGKLSNNADANLRMTKAINLLRMSVNSDIDVIEGLSSIYKNEAYGLQSEFNSEQWLDLSTEEKFAYTTQAVASYLKQNLENDGKRNEFLDKLDAVVTSEYILKNGSPKRIKIVRFKPNMNKIINEVDFTDQVRIIQKHFNKLPGDIQNFFVSYDFVTTGWGSNGNSLTPFFSDSKSQKINNIAEKVQDISKSNFEQDLRSFMLQNKLYKPSKQSLQEIAVAVNARRIASLSYLALYGNDGSFASFNDGGLFGVKKENIGLTDSNTVTTIQDYQSRIDRVKKSEKEINKKFQSDNDLLNVPMNFYSGVPEAAMINVLGLATHKEEKVTSNSDLHEGDGVKLLKVPMYEFDGTTYEGIGQKMDFDKFVTRKLPTGVKFDILAQEDKDSLERDYKIYEASVSKVKALYDEVRSQSIEDAVYDKDMSEQEALKKFNRIRDLFKEYNDILSYEKINIAALSQGNIFAEEAALVDNLIDELAANPLRRYMEYHFGNHIANNQINTWQKKHGKDLGDISDEMRAKDISSLNMWMSPGDFGKSKPAIAYINKNMKMTHIKYTRNINLVTKEMNEKLENLYKANYESDFEAKAARLWLKYMPMGTTSINQKLFGNILEITTGLKKVVDKDNNTTYRDVSDTRIKPSLVYENGDIKKGKGKPWHKLNKAEQEYLEMYVKFTNFYRDLVESKELYAYNRGGTYVPSITSSRWETLHKRGLFGVYYQMFKGDQDLADVVVEATNPLTGETEALDYFSWKSLYMYGSGEKIQLRTPNVKSPTQITPKKTKSGVVRIEELEKIKRKAQGYVDKGINYKGDKITRNSSINQLMSLESEEAMNRFNHKRSMTSSYLGTGNMHAALRSYLSLFMFQHGNAYKVGDKYKHLRYNEKTRAFQEEDDSLEDMANERLAFTGFDDKKQEVDAAIASLGGGKIFDPFAKYGDVKNKNAINYLQKVVKRGLINKERGFTFSDFESEADITNFFVNWTMYVALGLNVPAAFGNVLIGKFNAYRQMGGTNTALGEARYWGMDKKIGYDNTKRIKSRKMIEEFGILTYRAEEIAEGTGGSSLSSLIFSPMVLAENWIQQAAFLGALTDEQFDSYYVDDKGDLQLRDGAKGITSEELAILERDVVNVQGRGYSETDVRMIQMYALSNMTMQFKRWFPTFLRDRFGKEDIDDLGTMRMGAYTGAADFMSKLRDEGKMWNITEWNAELKKLPKHKQDAVMRYWRGTHGVMIVAMLLAISSVGSDDDEKDTEAFKLLEKLLGDMLLVVNAPKLTYMANIPALNTFKNLNLSIFHAVKGTEYKRKSKYGDKGDKKFVSNLAQLLPSPARAVLKEKKSSKNSLR